MTAPVDPLLRSGAEISTADYHTAGEPFRIITGGAPLPTGQTVADRRISAMATHDGLRAFLVNEPRGHNGMYGGFVVPPDPSPLGRGPDGALGVVFFHKDGFSTACGHGTIALTTWAIDSGVVAAVAPVTRISVDVPSGRLAVEADLDEVTGRVGEVRFVNVPSWVSHTGVTVEIGSRTVTGDLSFGGAFYLSVDARSVGLSVSLDDLEELTRLGRALRRSVDSHPGVHHPDDDRLSGCYGTIWYEALGERTGPEGERIVVQRNVTIFADGEIDRSPCGSGTSARLALLHQEGVIAAGTSVLEHHGIVGTRFSGRIVGEVEVAGRTGVVTQVGGRASRTGMHRFVLAADDEVGLGFQLTP